jgi:Na+/pantothenate symporter
MIDQLIYFAAVLLGDPLQDLAVLLAGLVVLSVLNSAIKRGWLSDTIKRIREAQPEQITIYDLNEQ